MKKIILFFSFTLLAIAVFHRPILGFITGKLINHYSIKHLGQPLNYERFDLSGTTAIVHQPSIKNKFEADKISITLNIDSLLRRKFNLLIELDKPIVLIEPFEASNKTINTFLNPKKNSWVKVNTLWNVKSGILKWKEKNITFQMDLDTAKGGQVIAKFNEFDEIKIEAKSLTDSMIAELTCKNMQCDSFFGIIPQLYRLHAMEDWNVKSGLINGHLTAVFPKNQRPSLEGELLIDHFNFAYDKLGLAGSIKKGSLVVNKDRTGKFEILESASISGQKGWQFDHVIGGIKIDPSKIALIAFEAQGLYQDKQTDFKIKGKANLNQLFDINLDILCQSEMEEKGHAQLIVRESEGKKLGELRFNRISHVEWGFLQTFLSAFYPGLKEIEFQAGILDGLLSTELSGKGLNHVHCQYLKSENLQFTYLPWEADFYFPKTSASGSISLLNPDLWSSLDAEIAIEEGRIEKNSHILSDVKTKLTIHQGQIPNSHAAFNLIGLKGLLDITWNKEKKLMTLNLDGKMVDIAQLFSKRFKNGIEDQFKENKVGILANIKENLELEGTIHISRGEGQFDLVHFGSDLKEWTHGPSGWFFAKELALIKYVSPFIFRRGVATLSGIGEFKGTFDPEKIAVKYLAKDLAVENEDILIEVKNSTISPLDGLPGSHIFYLKTGSHEGTVPLKNTTYYERNTDLVFEDMQAEVLFKDDTICLRDLEASCKGVSLCGQMDLDYSDPAPGVFNVFLSVPTISGTISQVRSILEHIRQPQLLAKLPLEGTIESKNQGLALGFDFVPKDYFLRAQFQGAISNGKVVFPTLNMTLQDLGMDVEYSHIADLLEFKDIQGTLLAGKPDQIEEYLLNGNYIKIHDIDKQNIEVDLQLNQKDLSLMRIVGHTKSSEDQVEINIDKSLSHLCTVHPKECHLILSHDWSKVQWFNFLLPFKLNTVWTSLKALSPIGSFLSPFLVEKIKVIPNPVGELELALDFNAHQDILTFQMEGKNIGFDHNSTWNSFVLKGKKQASKWSLEQFQLDKLSLIADAEKLGDEWKLSFLSLNFGDSLLLGLDGYFLGKTCCLDANINFLETYLGKIESLRKWEMQGLLKGKGKLALQFLDHAPWYTIDTQVQSKVYDLMISDFTFLNQKPFLASYKSNAGLELQDFETVIVENNKELAGCRFKHLQYHENQFSCSKVAFNIPCPYLENISDRLAKLFPEMINPYVKNTFVALKKEGSLLGSFSYDPKSITLALEDGIYSYKNKDYTIKDFVLTTNSKILSVKGITDHERCVFSFDSKAVLPKLDEGELTVSDDFPATNPLKIYWREEEGLGFQIISMRGEFGGMNFHLDPISDTVPSWSILRGQVDIDFNQICPLLSQEMAAEIQALQLSSFYTLSGTFWWNSKLGEDLLDTIYFKGNLEGRNSVVKGFQVDGIQANVFYAPNNCEIENLDLYDAAGSMKCQKISLVKNPMMKKWVFSIPQIEVKNLKPIFLRDLSDPTPTKFKSLVIKTIQLKDINGQLDDSNTWRGNGLIHFVNSSRKSSYHPIFAIPAEILLRLGLNPQVLSPVSGKINFHLANGRFYFTRFKDVFSEGKGSKFYLANPNSMNSWMDLKGNLSVQIRMKQYNLIFKLAELFTVSVKGTLKNPTYSLKKQDKKDEFIPLSKNGMVGRPSRPASGRDALITFS